MGAVVFIFFASPISHKNPMNMLSPQQLLAMPYYHSDISFDETSKRLMPQPVGTYLLRSSKSDPHALVLAFKTALGIEQCMLKPCAEGYAIGDAVFSVVDDIFTANQEILKIGLPAPLLLPEPALAASYFRATAPPDEIKEVIVRESLQEAATRSLRCCPVCFEDAVCCVLVPCGHIFCKACCTKLNTCALCRQKKDSFIVAWL